MAGCERSHPSAHASGPRRTGVLDHHHRVWKFPRAREHRAEGGFAEAGGRHKSIPMKTPALERLRRKLKVREPLYGLWCTLGAANVAEIAATLGLDWITVDLEHGHLEWAHVLENARAVRGSETAGFFPAPGIHPRATKTGPHPRGPRVILALFPTPQ